MTVSGGNLQEALNLYAVNTSLSESLYTPLQGVEIAVRNAIHESLTLGFREDWYDDSRLVLQPAHAGYVRIAKRTVRDRHKDVSPGRMVAEIGFGFWIGILGPKYETNLWRPHLRHAFPHRPRSVGRKEILSALNKIRRLRNRVAHHEPITHRNLLEDHETILRVIGWVCPDTAEWIESQSRFPAVFAAI